MNVFCTGCGARLEPGARFCSACGQAVARPGDVVASEGDTSASADRSRRFTFGCLMTSLLPLSVAAFVLVFVLGRGGCSSVEGRVEAHGKPLGDYVVTPKVCQSGAHRQFFGITVFADDDAPGTLIVADDPIRGRVVQALIDGSCHDDVEEEHTCSYAVVDRARCSHFELSIVPTSTTVNDVRLLDGHLVLDCQMPEGGTLKADLNLEDCD